jgi:5-methylcytosine-specific restriction endonuclease McrBC GTP-binding regulatory subunit McrB
MAEANPQKPVFLCLDEMNLARVEYYLSDFLSVIESREKQEDGSITTTGIAQYDSGIPDNLYIVGTVNMDETTFPFSRKVLDRANTIEFNYVDLMPAFDDALASQEPLKVSNQFLRSEYLILARDCVNESVYVNEICGELQAINEILRRANANVGYRVRDEIVFYMLENLRDGGILKREEAFDNEIMQKILPRIQGSSAAVKNMLCELFKRYAGEYESYQTESDDISSKMFKAAQKADCKYRKSAEKIAYMVRRFEEDGFTAYWL